MMLARYKKIANFTFLARWANLAKVRALHNPPTIKARIAAGFFISECQCLHTSGAKFSQLFFESLNLLF